MKLISAAEAEREHDVAGLARRIRVLAHRKRLFACGLDRSGRPLYRADDIEALLSDTPNASVPRQRAAV